MSWTLEWFWQWSVYSGRFRRTSAIAVSSACPERHRSPLLLRCLEDYLAGQRFPLHLVHTDASVLQPPR